MKIIVVDPDRRSLKQTADALQRLSGGEIIPFLSPIEAETYFHSNTADFVFTEIRMPHMDGLTLMERVRQHQPYTKTVILTSQTEYALEAMRRKAWDYILKPAEDKDFLQALSEKPWLLKE